MVDYSKWNNLDDYDSDYGEGELFCSHHSHNKENIKRGMNIEPAWIEKISIKKPVLPSYYVGSPLQKSQYQYLELIVERPERFTESILNTPL
jgi:hypothetical protein